MVCSQKEKRLKIRRLKGVVTISAAQTKREITMVSFKGITTAFVLYQSIVPAFAGSLTAHDACVESQIAVDASSTACIGRPDAMRTKADAAAEKARLACGKRFNSKACGIAAEELIESISTSNAYSAICETAIRMAKAAQQQCKAALGNSQ
jgi:hypothetical protein